MIAMQYSFTLPADYDMTIVRRRISEKGPALDELPGLAWKAYLHASADASSAPGSENLYAPFYLWNQIEAMNDFLASPAFVALTRAFGWPVVRLWPVWQAELRPTLRQASHATRQLINLPPHVDLAALREREQVLLAQDLQRGALAAVTACEPGGWNLLRLRLWPRAEPADAGQLIYQVGHVSMPTPNQFA